MAQLLKELGVTLGKTVERDGQVDSEPDISVCWVAKRVRVRNLKLPKRLGPSDRQAGLATTASSFERNVGGLASELERSRRLNAFGTKWIQYARRCC